MNKLVFLISPVRMSNPENYKKVESYVKKLEYDGFRVHWPIRDTGQEQDELDICSQNIDMITDADEVHIWFVEGSVGSIFDLGVAMSLNKKIVIANKYEVKKTEGKSFNNLLYMIDYNPDDIKIYNQAFARLELHSYPVFAECKIDGEIEMGGGIFAIVKKPFSMVANYITTVSQKYYSGSWNPGNMVIQVDDLTVIPKVLATMCYDVKTTTDYYHEDTTDHQRSIVDNIDRHFEFVKRS